LTSPFKYSEDVVIEKKIISVTSIGRNEATFQSQMPEPLQVKDQPGVSSANASVCGNQIYFNWLSLLPRLLIPVEKV
jgi:hypothetical protein